MATSTIDRLIGRTKMHYTFIFPELLPDRMSKEDEKLPNYIFRQLATDLL